MRVELRTVVGPFLRSSHSLHLLRKPAVVCIRGGRASESVSRSLALTRIRALSSASVRPCPLSQLQSWQSQGELTSFLQLSAHFISNSNLQRRERAGETGRPRGRRGRAGMFNVNFYGTTAWQREGKRGRGQKAGEGERASSATKSGFITKAAGHCRFMAAGGQADAARAQQPPSSLCCGLSFLFHVSICTPHAQSVSQSALSRQTVPGK